jgi:hypothetical protein
VPPPSPHAERGRRATPSDGEHALLDELDVAVVVSRQAPWQLAPFHAAVEADVGEEWRGGVYLVDDGSPQRTARAAREALGAHHRLARRTILTLPRRLGPTGALDLALAEGTGEYAALLDVATRPAPGTLGTLLDELHEHPRALWAAAPTPGCAVVRRQAFLTLGGFDPALRDGEALRDAAARARAAGHELLTVADARARRDGASVPPRHGPRLRRPAPSGRRPWSGVALAAWLPRARRAAVRVDLP